MRIPISSRNPLSRNPLRVNPTSLYRRETMPIINPGPYSPFHSTPQQDRMSDQEWRKIFDNLDSSEKVGYPYVGLFGREECREEYGKCPYDNHKMVILEERNLVFCPFCRRQLAISDPKEQKLNINPQLETQERIDGSPLPSEMSFDWRKYPGQVTKDY